MILFWLIVVFIFSIISTRSFSRNIKRLRIAKDNSPVDEEKKAFEWAIIKQVIQLALSILLVLFIGGMFLLTLVGF